MVMKSPAEALLGSRVTNDPNADEEMLRAKMVGAMPDVAADPLKAALDFTNKAYDEKARILREARSAPTGLERLRGALLAAAVPSRGGSNWDALRQGLAAWNESGVAARDAEEKQRLGLMGLEAERNLSLAELAAKYKPEKAGTDYNISAQVINNEPYTVYSAKDGSQAFALGPGGKRLDLGPQKTEAAAAPPPSRAGGQAAGRPSGGPLTREQFLAIPPDQRAGLEFIDADGKVKRATLTGGLVTVTEGENRPATAEEAKSYGYLRGRFEGGMFKGDEGDKLPSAEALNAEIIRDENRIAQLTSTLQTAKDLIPQVNQTTTGLVGSAARFVPGSAAADLYNTINDTLGGNIAFDRLQQMRDESKTGGALGQVAVAELDALKGSIASLKVSNSPEQLRSNLQKVVVHYERAINAYNRMLADKRARMQSVSGGGQGGASAQPASSGWGKMTVK